MVTGPAIARGAALPMVTCTYTTAGKGVRERMVTLGGSTNLSTCNPPLIAMGDRPTQQLGGRNCQNQAGQYNRRRPAVCHQQITAFTDLQYRQWFEHYSVFELVFTDDTCAATSGCYQPEVFSCTPTQKIDSPHSQRYRIASKASNI